MSKHREDQVQFAVCYNPGWTYPNIFNEVADADKWIKGHPDPENCIVIRRYLTDWEEVPSV